MMQLIFSWDQEINMKTEDKNIFNSIVDLHSKEKKQHKVTLTPRIVPR